MIYMTGDTHGYKGFKRFYPSNFVEGSSMTKDDYVVVLGDFGIPWNNNGSDKYWLEWLNQAPWTTLFIDGNHENFNLLNQYPVEEWKGGKIHKIKNSIYHLIRGEVFTIDGETILAAGGAQSIDKESRIPYSTWWPEENWTAEDCTKIYDASLNHSIDYVFAHTASTNIIDRFYEDTQLYRYNCDVSNIMEQMKIPFNKKWYFGHMHMDRMFDGKYVCLFTKIVKLGKYV
jgi:hypothetical protein